jgi:hypothetical protein
MVAPHSSRAYAPFEALRRKSLRAPGGPKKIEDDPMNQAYAQRLTNIRASARCGAKTRAGSFCKCPSMKGRMRCRLHGGRNTGPPRGSGNGNYRDGTYTAEALDERQWLRSVVRTYAKLEKL